MYLTNEKKSEIFEKYGEKAENSGSAECQVALYTFRINHLNEHLKENRKDFGTQRALLKLVGKRKKLLRYIRETDVEGYRDLIKDLGLRK